MKYTLMRCQIKKIGSRVIELIFDFWNYEFDTGYEIKVNLWHMTAWIKQIEKYTAELSGHTYDISRWDLIIRNIKQMKLANWIVYKEGEK